LGGFVARFFLLFAAFVMLPVSSASSQYVTTIMACSRDVSAFCNTANFDGNRLAECTKEHFEKFREPCKTALVKIAAVREACRSDIQAQCSGVRLGSGRLLLCVKKHFSALSEPCRGAIGNSAVKRLRTERATVF
jgi:hypothetical protein